MIVSASRRTDLPAFYSSWFFQRLQQGFALVRNPMNPGAVRRVSLDPEIVDCIVFWTKNPRPMMQQLSLLDGYGLAYYFLFTITSYNRSLEPNVPPLEERLESFVELSRRIGKERVIWRYDPILLTEAFGVQEHLRGFARIARRIGEHTTRCIISFLVPYRKCRARLQSRGLLEIGEEEKKRLAGRLRHMAGEHNLRMESCAEAVDCTEVGIGPGKCIDDELIGKILGRPLETKKDRSQRKRCRCVQSVDIGAYNTCLHHCLYCYAAGNAAEARRRYAGRNDGAPLLGEPLRAAERAVCGRTSTLTF